MNHDTILSIVVFAFSLTLFGCSGQEQERMPNPEADGYRGIWYMNTPLDNEYRYKYSGGLGTYCAKHDPFAVYAPAANKTFFCYGGTSKDSHERHALGEVLPPMDSSRGILLHMVSYYDHNTGMVPQPVVVMDKRTHDAHDNPVISIDAQGYVWVFSTSHGTSRPSYIHRSSEPYDIDAFELVEATIDAGDGVVPLTNFSYWQVWPHTEGGFEVYFTKYNNPVARTLFYTTSTDGMHWTNHSRIAAFGVGHYQISARGAARTGTAFNYHPDRRVDGLPGLNLRTNLYYVETADRGERWTNAAGESLSLPLVDVDNPALVAEYESDSLLVYLKDIAYDSEDHPVILYITSHGYASGPENGPRQWTIARWTGSQWVFSVITESDNNYDMGSLYLAEDVWRMIGPTETGPQPFNPGGEVAMWESVDKGATWSKAMQLTHNSPRNHTYVRNPVQAHPDFVAFWADGHGRQASESRLYFSNDQGAVFMLPQDMAEEMTEPIRLQ